MPKKRIWISGSDWNLVARRCVTPAVNLVIQNGKGEILYLMRLNEPMKGKLWLPGGRLATMQDETTGVATKETIREAVMRVTLEEVGIPERALEVVAISTEIQEEQYFTKDMDAAAVEKNYGPGVDSIAYWTTVAYLRLTDDSVKLSVDDQSSGWQWSKKIPHDHPYVAGYFAILKRMGYDVSEK